MTSLDLAGEASSFPSCSPSSPHPALQRECIVDASVMACQPTYRPILSSLFLRLRLCDCLSPSTDGDRVDCTAEEVGIASIPPPSFKSCKSFWSTVPQQTPMERPGRYRRLFAFPSAARQKARRRESPSVCCPAPSCPRIQVSNPRIADGVH